MTHRLLDMDLRAHWVLKAIAQVHEGADAFALAVDDDALRRQFQDQAARLTEEQLHKFNSQ